MPLSHSVNTHLPPRVWFEESFDSSWNTNHRVSPSSPAHFILFLSSRASDCLSLEAWQCYINLLDLGEQCGLPTWLSKDHFWICRFLEMLTKSSNRKASASWWHFLASQLTFTLVNMWWALHQKQSLTLILQVSSLLKIGAVYHSKDPFPSSLTLIGHVHNFLCTPFFWM